MSAFPALSSGTVGKYPLTRGERYRTMVYSHVDLSEQRFSKGNGPLASFDLVFNNVKTADKNLVRAFFTGTLGAADTTWSITLNDPIGTPTIYTNLQFVPNQRFTAENISPDRWAFTLKVRQTRKN